VLKVDNRLFVSEVDICCAYRAGHESKLNCIGVSCTGFIIPTFDRLRLTCGGLFFLK
jgi:hypothetical protein